MTPKPRIGLYLMSAKGHAVLECLLKHFGPGYIAYVVTSRDQAVEQDYHDAIVQSARSAGLAVYNRTDAPAPDSGTLFFFAVSWRWLIPTTPLQQLIVFHDSILPRYRGFAPLVSALVNGDSQLGVTALLASAEYDRGPIIAQDTITVTYPLKVAQAIDALTACYQRLVVGVGEKLINSSLTWTVQDESRATYSLWRDDQDYFIDWSWDADRIQRFVNAVGFPYLGAATAAHGFIYRIFDCSVLADVGIENREPGKIIFSREKEPVVVCGRGLLQIHKMIEDQSHQDALPLKQFRICFHTPARA
jgi:methionyl-tRNA formyltransferase